METHEELIEFPFPFRPYEIQQKFMLALYATLRDRKLGIFESPTGTGKSLSMCCGALQWLKQHERREIEYLETQIDLVKSEISTVPEGDDWLASEYNKIKKTQELNTLTSKLDKIRQRKTYFEEMKVRVKKVRKNINIKTPCAFENTNRIKDDKYDNEKENKSDFDGGGDDKVEDMDLILDELDDKPDEDCSDEDEKEDEDDNIKLYISSRTHSQLSQLVGEIERTVFSASARVITIASRLHYCINTDVARLKNIQLINERCLDLQKSKSKSTCVSEEGKVLKKTKTKACTSCPYYNQTNITRLKERMLVEIMDMEDLVKNGKELKACPYYAARAAVNDAQVVLVSHAGIVSSGARSGVSLRLRNNVLLLDEAHGLTSALEQAHSAPLSAKQLSATKKYMQFYVDKYRDRLNSRNLLSLNQILFVVGKLLGMIEAKPGEVIKQSEETRIFTLENFLITAEVDHMNLRPLVEFCRNTRLPQKLHGFSMRYNAQALEQASRPVAKKNSLQDFLSTISKKKTEEPVEIKVASTENNVQSEGSAGSSLYAVLNFLIMLCERSENGRVLIQKSSQFAGQLKYLLLNPAVHFAELVGECRSVILAGGTMEPISEFRTLLTGGSTNPQMATERISVLRCDHVVSPDNVLAVCLSRGPSNLTLNFSYENRQSKELLDEVGRTLRNLAGVVPGGVVCFVPSYSYEQMLFDHLKTTRVVEHISKKKKIFREPKSAAQVDQVLAEYAAAVRCKDGGATGAMMLSVVGGKLSEGLNFSDELGRCVVVVGMPYPSIKSPELQEKMSYLSRTEGHNAGNIYYENLCMKAVNQCIGRAVRHANDYACVLLLDERYSRPSTTAALPSFVQKSLRTNLNFGSTFGSIAKFFAKHKHKKD